jgi:hypothetical protein
LSVAGFALGLQSRRKAAANPGSDARLGIDHTSTEVHHMTDTRTIFDALHDRGDPIAALAHIRRSLATDGTLMLVEPNAGDRVEDNLNVVGKTFDAASTQICTPASRAQGGDHAACLGAQPGDARLRAIAENAGFTSIRRATETPFNIVLELRR